MSVLNGLRRWQSLSAVLALVGLLDSLYLVSFKLGRPLVCGLGDCDAVNSSPYSEIAGVPVSVIGVLGYLVLLALALWALFGSENAPYWLSDVRLFFTGLGVLFSLYLTGLELFVIHAI
ncbi:MAG: hypothetical protein M1570_08545 [Chloroflexi bacterium]|nr:hypothetical protein [Chloroflexota bacterium]